MGISGFAVGMCGRANPAALGFFSRTIPAEPFGSREIPAIFPQTWIA